MKANARYQFLIVSIEPVEPYANFFICILSCFTLLFVYQKG